MSSTKGGIVSEASWNFEALVSEFRNRVNYGIDVLEADRPGSTSQINILSLDLGSTIDCAMGQVAAAHGTSYTAELYRLAGYDRVKDRFNMMAYFAALTLGLRCGFDRIEGLSWDQCTQIWREELVKRRLQAQPLTVIAPEEMAVAA